MYDTLFRLNNQLVTVDMLVDGVEVRSRELGREFAVNVPLSLGLDSFEEEWYNDLREAA